MAGHIVEQRELLREPCGELASFTGEKKKYSFYVEKPYSISRVFLLLRLTWQATYFQRRVFYHELLCAIAQIRFLN